MLSDPSSGGEMKNEIKDWRNQLINKSINAGTKVGSEGANRDDLATRVFRDALIELWKILEKRGVGTGLLMLDDAHYLSSKFPDALDELRTLFQELPQHGCNFILCITGRTDLFSDISGYNGIFTNFFNIKHTLNPFKLDEVKDAILRPLKLSGLGLAVDEKVIKKIYEITKGYPVFINFIMRELVYLRGDGRITLRDFEENYPAIMESMVRYRFKNDFSIASDKEKEILLAMSKLSDIFSPFEIGIKNARTHLRFLVKKGLIVKHDRGRYSLYHPFFKEYLRSLGEKRNE